MQNPASSHVVRSIQRHVPQWLRRALLLAGVVLSLAMVGDPAVAGTRSSSSPDPSSGLWMNPGRSGVTLAMNTVGAMYRSIDQWSDGATEAISLLALGLGLIGAGRVLGQKRHATQSALSAPETHGRADDVLKPHDIAVPSLAHRAVR